VKELKDTWIAGNWGQLLTYIDQRVNGIEIGYRDLDNYLLGLGNTVGIQGDTGSNKSTLVAQIIRHNLMKGIPAILMDKENGVGRVLSRMICQTNHISETVVKTAKLTDMERLKEYRKPIKEAPLHIHTEPITDFELLDQRIGELFEMYNNPKSAILAIDSFQALNKVAQDDRVSLEAWAYFFDQLKEKYEGRLTIINVNEKKMSSYGQEDLNAAKGTNATGYKNETILNIKENEEGQLEIKVLKNRDGIKGARFKFDKELMDPNNPRSFTFNLLPVGELNV